MSALHRPAQMRDAAAQLGHQQPAHPAHVRQLPGAAMRTRAVHALLVVAMSVVGLGFIPPGLVLVLLAVTR